MRSTSGNFDVFNSRDDIYLVFTEKSKFSFYFILFRRFTVKQLTMSQAESHLEYLGHNTWIYSHWDFQISASKCETSEVISNVINV